ncbi:sensor domain-containing protein [Mycobacterium kyogaense]|uniref:sensor domain-containing protein n=1 Tax=Mycobacterium kyogaense TaxID=2212479 RepID=UPI000DADD36D|nr:sensor domain-containing protein [Mycobacterium kyogaense]
MRRWLVVALAVVATGCGGGVAGTAVPAPAGGLDSVLLGDVELDELLHTSGFHSDPDGKEFTDELAKGARPPGCVHTVNVADRNIYSDAGPTAVVTRSSSSPAGTVDQSVVVVRSAKDAQRLFDTSKLSWDVCVGVPVTTGGSAPATWQREPVEVADGIATQRTTRSDRVGEQCQHAMGVAVATVVEAMVCGPGVTNEAFTVVAKMVRNADRT